MTNQAAEIAPLTDDERDALTRALIEPDDDCAHNLAPLFEEVESIAAECVRSERARLLAAIAEFDSSDAYHFGKPGEADYYSALDRVEALLRGEINVWTDLPNPPDEKGRRNG